MKRRQGLLVLIVVICLIFALALTACGNQENADNESGGAESGGGTEDNGDTGDNGGNSDPVLKKFSGITFVDSSVVYDASSHKIEVVGAPSDATITYVGNDKTDVGVYTVNATIKKAGYETLELSAKLTITKATMQNVTFDDDSFEYDTHSHSIVVVGNIPKNSTVTYSGGEDELNGATTPGKYTITALITNPNYNDLTLTATITITSKTELLNMTVFNGQVYFQNPLDQNKLYTVDSMGQINLVNKDVPKGFVSVGNKLYYLSDGLLVGGINMYDGEKAETLFEVKGEYLASDGTNMYYAVASLTDKTKNGIYSVSIADMISQSADPVAVKICDKKAENLVVCNNYIYFANKDDKGKLYRVATNGSNLQKVYDFKVSDMIVDNGILYYCKHETLSAYLERIDTTKIGALPLAEDSVAIKKLTMSKGKYLTKVGDYIYFINTDMVTSNIAGDGVYKVKADGSSWVSDAASLLTGAQKVIAVDKDTIFSLSAVGDKLYFYRTSNKHLHEYDVVNNIEKDLMDGFVPPEVKEVITAKYTKTQMYDDQLYFINMYDNGRLYKHDFTTNADIKITNAQVADFVISNKVLYYSTLRALTNFDLYKMSLVDGEVTRLSKDKCVNLGIDGEYLYYTNMSGSNTFNRMKLDGTANEEITAKASDWQVTVVGNKVYYVADKCLNVYDIETSTASVVNKDIKPNAYIIHNNKVYYMNNAFKNTVRVYDLTTNAMTELVDLGATQDARSFFVYNDEVYFYRNVATGTTDKGLYKIKADNTVELVNVLDGYFMASAQVVGDKVYFIDAWVIQDALPHTDSTGKICEYNLIDNTIKYIN